MKKELPDEDSFSNDMLIIDDTPGTSLGNTPPKNKLLLGKTAPNNNPNSNNKKRKKRDSASSDEERWLTAIESGKLEDVDDELKKIKPKDPALMTARQRAMYDRGGNDGSPSSTPQLMSLPTGYKEKIMTAESIQKAAIKSQKRKQLADEKREKDKKKTMERLLKKQESKASKSNKFKPARSLIPSILYRQTNDETFVALPENVDFPLKTARLTSFPKKVYCSMKCGNLKKYSCSRTGVPLCSLGCYKKNISNRII